MAGNYKDTLNLPKTDFPMKADLVQKEPERLGRWQTERLYEKILEARKDAPLFVLHDGPPYANGDVHIGTALNKILKDIVVRHATMTGCRAPYVPGWDCHGLPIELKVQKEIEKSGEKLSSPQVRKKCRDYAQDFVDKQRNQFKQLGVMGDWDRPYLTMSPDYEAAIVETFYEMRSRGYIYRALKPGYWCISCRTALAAATAESEYKNHESPSIYVKFPVHGKLGGQVLSKTYVLVWTTTPWTLPANLSVTLHPDADYVFVRVGEETWILAERLLGAVASKTGKQFGEIVRKMKGAALAAEKVFPDYPFTHLPDRPPFTLATYVTMEDGTGCVHTAPGHGIEDAETGDKYKLEPRCYSPLDDAGRFLADGRVPAELVGKSVWKANDFVIQLLKDKDFLVAEQKIEHSYPHCWRCKKPVIFRSTDQWFVKVDNEKLRERALAAVRDPNQIRFVPEWGVSRFSGMLAERPDWCISRQRVWGVPIPVISCSACGHQFPEADQQIVDLVRKNGIEIWFQKSAGELLGPHYSGQVGCPKCKGATVLKKETDILDVWFESGCSHRGVLKTNAALKFPADVYLEGSDQHRGWFQVSLLTALATGDQMPPYKTVVTHGFLVSPESGEKVSKSVGKPANADDYVSRFGADILRLWVISEDYRNDVPLSEEIITRVGETYRKIRNTLRFLLSNLYDFSPATNSVPFDKQNELDRWALSRLQAIIDQVRRAYAEYEYHRVYHTLNAFCSVDLSSFYLDILKDRLYTFAPNSSERRSSQTTLLEVVVALAKLLAPVLPFTAEEVWDELRRLGCVREESVHLSLLPEARPAMRDEKLEQRWKVLGQIRNTAQLELETARAAKLIGKSLDARLTLRLSSALREMWGGDVELLCTAFNVSQVEVVDLGATGIKKWSETVAKAAGQKCARCWNWREDVGQNAEYTDLCGRCAVIVKEWKGNHEDKSNETS